MNEESLTREQAIRSEALEQATRIVCEVFDGTVGTKPYKHGDIDKYELELQDRAMEMAQVFATWITGQPKEVG